MRRMRRMRMSRGEDEMKRRPVKKRQDDKTIR
jgi:hypothetical protein